MVKKKKFIYLAILSVFILIGTILSININTSSFFGEPSPKNIKKEHNFVESSPITFNEKPDFNISYKTIELTVFENQKDILLVDMGSKPQEIYLSYNEPDRNVYVVKNYITGEEKILYENKNVFATAIQGVYNDILYIIETIIQDEKLVSDVVLVNNNGSVYRYNIGKMDKIPYVQQLDNLLLINYEYREENMVKTYLTYFDMTNFNQENILQEQYTENLSGTVTGKYILFAGGMENTIYYQIVEYNDEDIEKGGKSYIYKINKNDINSAEKLFELENKALFLSGDENSLIISDYVFEPPFYDSGKLYIKNNDNWSYTIIPNVTAGADLIGAEKISDKVLLIFNNESFYIYDYINKQYIEERYRKKFDSLYSRINVSSNKFLYLEDNNGKFYLHVYSYFD